MISGVTGQEIQVNTSRFQWTFDGYKTNSWLIIARTLQD